MRAFEASDGSVVFEVTLDGFYEDDLGVFYKTERYEGDRVMSYTVELVMYPAGYPEDEINRPRIAADITLDDGRFITIDDDVWYPEPQDEDEDIRNPPRYSALSEDCIELYLSEEYNFRISQEQKED